MDINIEGVEVIVGSRKEEKALQQFEKIARNYNEKYKGNKESIVFFDSENRIWLNVLDYKNFPSQHQLRNQILIRIRL